MTKKIPDTWIIVEISGSLVEGSKYHRILAGWYGGFATGDSWQMNSGITKIVDHDNYYEIHGKSGSTYLCHKNAEKLSGYTADIYESYRQQNTEEVSLERVEIKDIISLYQ